MNALAQIFYVEGDLIGTMCNIIGVVIALEFVALMARALSSIGR